MKLQKKEKQMNSEQNHNLSAIRNLVEQPNILIETRILAESHTLVGNQLLSETYLLSRVSSITNTVTDDEMSTTSLLSSFSGSKIVNYSGLIKDIDPDDDDDKFHEGNEDFLLNRRQPPLSSTNVSILDELRTQYSVPMNDNQSISEISDITTLDFVEDSSIKTFHSGGGGGGGGCEESSPRTASMTICTNKSCLEEGMSRSVSGTKSLSTKLSSTYDCTRFSKQQISAAKEVIDHFENGPSRWVLLFAQMQSGKTDTFLLVGCEMLRREKINKIIVFSGNSETDLRDQLIKQIDSDESKFYIKYRNYLQTIGTLDEDVEDIIAKSIDQTEILWGPDLLKKRKHQDRKTLFIWEESHYAQSLNNRPKKFMEMVGISADGTIDPHSGKYGLSVSATPFSELVDNIQKDQHKPIVYLRPGEGYRGVHDIITNGQLHTFTDVNHGLTTALKYTNPTDPKYAVIRSSCKNIQAIKKILVDANWTFVEYDSKTKDTRGETTWNSMGTKPKRHTAILIKERCRMGKNVDKSHLLFVFEPVIDTKTDTALQGLLGRVCGYSKGSADVHVWVSEKLMTSQELINYTKTVKTITDPNAQLIIPNRGTNLVPKSSNQYNKCPLLPIKIKLPGEDLPQYERDLNGYKRGLALDELERFINNNHTMNIPNILYRDFITQLCQKCLSGYVDEPKGIRYKIEVHDVCSKLSNMDIENETSTRKWTNLIPKLKDRHITTSDVIHKLDLPETNEDDYLWDTYAKQSQQTDGTKKYSKSEREGYIVHLFVFKSNPLTMLARNKLNQFAKPIIASFAESDIFDIEPNTMFLWGVVDYPEGVNPNNQLPSTNNREVFGRLLQIKR